MFAHAAGDVLRLFACTFVAPQAEGDLMLLDGQQSCHKLRIALGCPDNVPLVAWSSAAANLDSTTCAAILGYVSTASCDILQPFLEQISDLLPDRVPTAAAAAAAASAAPLGR